MTYNCVHLLRSSKVNTLLMCDFNYHDVRWNPLDATSQNSKMFIDCLEDNFLAKYVKEATRNMRHESVLDLVMKSGLDVIKENEVLGKFSSSDHNLLHWSWDIMVNCEQ